MKNFLRWLGIHVHDWSKWKQIGLRHVYIEDGVRLCIGRVFEKTCTTCGLPKIRLEDSTGDHPL